MTHWQTLEGVQLRLHRCCQGGTKRKTKRKHGETKKERNPLSSTVAVEHAGALPMICLWDALASLGRRVEGGVVPRGWAGVVNSAHPCC
jgi:hypothetical protein